MNFSKEIMLKKVATLLFPLSINFYTGKRKSEAERR